MAAKRKQKDRTGDAGVIASESSLWSAVGNRIGEGLTPRRVSDVLRAADNGYTTGLHDALNEIRQKDAVVHSLLQTRERGLMSCGWEIVSAETGEAKDSPEFAQAEEVAAFVREAIGSVIVRVGELSYGFGRALLRLLDAIYKGFSVIEIDWTTRDGSLVPGALRPIAGRRFGWDEYQRLCLVDVDGRGTVSYPGLPLSDYSNKFLVHLPQVNGDEPVREGLGRLILWHACFRLWSWRDWLLFAELYGKPWRTFVYAKDGADDDDVDLAKAMARSASSKTAMAYPDTITASVSWPTATGGAQASPSPAILQRAEEELSLAVIGQKATTGTVSGGLGSSGDVRDLVRKDLIAADEAELCETIERQLFAPMVSAKFGSLKYLPRLTFATAENDSLATLLDALDKGVKLGAKVPVAYLHDVAGWPTAEGDEEVLGSSSPAMRDPAEAQGATEPPAPDALPQEAP